MIVVGAASPARAPDSREPGVALTSDHYGTLRERDEVEKERRREGGQGASKRREGTSAGEGGLTCRQRNTDQVKSNPGLETEKRLGGLEVVRAEVKAAMTQIDEHLKYDTGSPLSSPLLSLSVLSFSLLSASLMNPPDLQRQTPSPWPGCGKRSVTSALGSTRQWKSAR
eukprot:768156-Hanusia_phi.AAC.3